MGNYKRHERCLVQYMSMYTSNIYMSERTSAALRDERERLREKEKRESGRASDLGEGLGSHWRPEKVTTEGQPFLTLGSYDGLGLILTYIQYRDFIVSLFLIECYDKAIFFSCFGIVSH